MPKDGKVRVGVIGCGGISQRMHLPSLARIEKAEVVAVCDLVAEKAKSQAEKYGIPNWYTLHPEMLAKEDLDAVFCLVEPDRMFRPVVECLEAGKHVMMEKPPGITTFQAETIMRTARDRDLIVQVGFNRRYIPVVQKVVEMMRERTRITQVEGQFIKHGTAAFCKGAIPAFESDTIHAIDLMLWVAQGTPVAGALVENHVEDVCPNIWNGVCRFDNGVTGIVKANYQTGGRTHSLAIHGPGASAFVNLGFGDASCGAQLFFSGGAGGYSISATGTNKNERISLDGVEMAEGDEFFMYYGFYNEDKDFIDCVLEGRKPLADIEAGVRAMQFCDFMRAHAI